MDARYMNRASHHRARWRDQIRVPSVLAAHGALYTSIRRGLLQPNDRLDEDSLVPMFSVSRNSIRGALQLLADEGMVARTPRIGTTVVSNALEVPLDTALGWKTTPHPHVEHQVIDSRWAPTTPVVRHQLRTARPSVHLVETLGIYGGKPTTMYTRYTFGEGATRPHISSPKQGNFEQLFEMTYGSPLATVDSWIEAKEADKRAAARLRVPVGTPLLVRSRVLTSADGIPREYGILHYVGALVTLAGAVDRAEVNLAETRSSEPAGVHGAAVLRPVPSELEPQDVADTMPRRRSSTELHTQLRAAIRDGLFVVGDQLVEDHVAEAFGSSRNTVRIVLAKLTEEGILRRTRRDGTIVLARIADYTLNDAMPYRPEDRHRHTNERLASVTIPTPPFIAALLRTDSSEISLNEYLAFRDGRPMSVTLRYTEPRAVPRPLTTGRTESFAELFESTYGVVMGRIETSVHPVKADEQVARRLGVRTGSLLLLVEQIVTDASGQPHELCHSYHRASHVTLASHHTVGIGPTIA